MTSPDYRQSPIWKKARHLVLALSLAADSFGSRGESRSKTIRQHSVHLLLEIVELCEARTGLQAVESSLTRLEQNLSESHLGGFLAKSAHLGLARKIKDLRSALQGSPWRNQAIAGSGPDSTPTTRKLSFSPSTGVLS